MESFFKTSFGDVRIHIGPHATALGALAFTHGSHIHFAPGQYKPITPQGQQLLGHELTHVVQQRAGRVRSPFGAGVAVVQDANLEAEADRMGRQAASHSTPVQAKPMTPTVQRKPFHRLPGSFASRRLPAPYTAIQRANASTRGITSEIGDIDEDVFHQIKQRLGGSPDESHRILRDGTIDPIGANLFYYVASHPSFERIFTSEKSQGNYETWQIQNPLRFQSALEEAQRNEDEEERQRDISRDKRGGSKKQVKVKGPSKKERRALKQQQQRELSKREFPKKDDSDDGGSGNPEGIVSN